QEPGGKGGEHKVAEGFSQNGAQGIFGTKCTLPRSHRCERGKGADNQEHDAARRIAEPGHPLKYGLLAHVLLSSFLSMSMSSSSCTFRLWFGRWHGTARERGGKRGGNLVSFLLQPRRTSMKLKLLIAAAGLAAFVTPSLAAEFYIVQDTTTKRCSIVEQRPTTTTMHNVGPGTAYTTRTEAEAGMKTVKVCESGGTVGGPAAPAPRR